MKLIVIGGTWEFGKKYLQILKVRIIRETIAPSF